MGETDTQKTKQGLTFKIQITKIDEYQSVKTQYKSEGTYITLCFFISLLSMFTIK